MTLDLLPGAITRVYPVDVSQNHGKAARGTDFIGSAEPCRAQPNMTTLSAMQTNAKMMMREASAGSINVGELQREMQRLSPEIKASNYCIDSAGIPVCCAHANA